MAAEQEHQARCVPLKDGIRALLAALDDLAAERRECFHVHEAVIGPEPCFLILSRPAHRVAEADRLRAELASARGEAELLRRDVELFVELSRAMSGELVAQARRIAALEYALRPWMAARETDGRGARRGPLQP